MRDHSNVHGVVVLSFPTLPAKRYACFVRLPVAMLCLPLPVSNEEDDGVRFKGRRFPMKRKSHLLILKESFFLSFPASPSLSFFIFNRDEITAVITSRLKTSCV